MPRTLLTPARVSVVFSCLVFLGFLTVPAHAGSVVHTDYDAKQLNSGDTAWMLTSSALVLLMTGPGLALFYSGLVRRKNVLGTMMQSFILMAVVSIVWAIVGYSVAFDTFSPLIGGFKFFGLHNVGATPCDYAPTIPHTTWMVYQCMFAVITPGLICGAYAERMKFSAMLTFSILWLLLVYCPLAHMVWGKGGLFNIGVQDGPGGNSVVGALPALDFAGGTVVHISSGISALVCALVLGKRRGYGRVPMPPHSVVLSVIGAALLWVGWFGFNAGSALTAGPLASSAFINTHFAAASATLGWMLVEWWTGGKPTVLGAISGAVAGLVAITPASGFVGPMSSLIIGAVGGVACFFTATSMKHFFGYDDSLDAFGVHGVGGTIGAILTGVFAVSWVNSAGSGAVDGHPIQVLHQLAATALTWVLAALMTFLILQLTRLLCRGLRLSEADEYDGLDISQHGESGYNFEESIAATVEDGGGRVFSHA